jgi:hypothetical protein
MTTAIFFIVLIASGAVLIRYARNDRFAGPGTIWSEKQEARLHRSGSGPSVWN